MNYRLGVTYALHQPPSSAAARAVAHREPRSLSREHTKKFMKIDSVSNGELNRIERVEELDLFRDAQRPLPGLGPQQDESETAR